VDAPFGQEFGHVGVRQMEPQIPTDSQGNDVIREAIAAECRG